MEAGRMTVSKPMLVRRTVVALLMTSAWQACTSVSPVDGGLSIDSGTACSACTDGGTPTDSGVTPGDCGDAGLLWCSGSCIDPRTDSSNCGRCGIACFLSRCLDGWCHPCGMDIQGRCSDTSCRICSGDCWNYGQTIGFIPDYTVCGSQSVCFGGECGTCTTPTTCILPWEPCREGVVDCDAGGCHATGRDVADGGSCGSGRRCEQGACVGALGCRQIRDWFPDAGDGVYLANYDNASPPRDRYVGCDMTTPGGPFTLWFSPDLEQHPDNLSLPRCGPSLERECFTGSFVGRGEAFGLYRISDAGIVEQLQPALTWNRRAATLRDGGACGSCADSGTCLFSTLSDSTCCTSPTTSNLCLGP
jgi:hypothetical protein